MGNEREKKQKINGNKRNSVKVVVMKEREGFGNEGSGRVTVVMSFNSVVRQAVAIEMRVWTACTQCFDRDPNTEVGGGGGDCRLYSTWKKAVLNDTIRWKTKKV